MIVEKLAAMLMEAAEIIAYQAEIMEQHGIQTLDGCMENHRQALVGRIKEYVGDDECEIH